MKVHILKRDRPIAEQVNKYIDLGYDRVIFVEGNDHGGSSILENINDIFNKNEHHAIIGISFIYDSGASNHDFDDYYITPFISSSFFALDIPTLRNSGGLKEKITNSDQCLAEYGLRINMYGYNTLMAKFNTGDRGLSERYGNFSIKEMGEIARFLKKQHSFSPRVVEQYASFKIDPGIHFAAVIGKKHAESRHRILFSMQNMTSAYNGTAEYSLALLNSFARLFDEKFEIDVIVSKDVWNFYKKSFPLNVGVYFFDKDEERLPLYHIIFSPSQVWEMKYLSLFNRISPRIISTFLDAIILRSDYLNSSHAGGHTDLVNSFLMKYADGIIAISDTAHDDIFDYFHLLKTPHLKTRVVLLGSGFKLRGHDNMKKKFFKNIYDEKISKIVERKYILIIGNKLKHKSIAETYKALEKLDIHKIYIGLDADSYKKNGKSTFLSGGDISDGLIQKLYSNAHLIIFPSQYEGFGLPIVKAIEYNKKIILFDSSVNHEIAKKFIRNSNQAFYFKEFKKLPEIVSEHLGAYELQMVDIRTWDDVARDTEMFFREILETEIDKNHLRDRWRTINLLNIEKKRSKCYNSIDGEIRKVIKKIVVAKKLFF